jgi:hypothetical protein
VWRGRPRATSCGTPSVIRSGTVSNSPASRVSARSGRDAKSRASSRACISRADELGLEEVEDLPEAVLQDPTWNRSGHTVRGRDGCRVPIPWSGTEPPFGFGSVEHPPWLPQPAHWVDLSPRKTLTRPAC